MKSPCSMAIHYQLFTPHTLRVKRRKAIWECRIWLSADYAGHIVVVVPFFDLRGRRHVRHEPPPISAGARLAGRQDAGRRGAHRGSHPRCGQRLARGVAKEKRAAFGWHRLTVSSGYRPACVGCPRSNLIKPNWHRGHCCPAHTPDEGEGGTRSLSRAFFILVLPRALP